MGSETAIARLFIAHTLAATVTGLGFFYTLLRFGPRLLSGKGLSVPKQLAILGILMLLGLAALFTIVRALVIRRDLGAIRYAKCVMADLENGTLPVFSAGIKPKDGFDAATADFAGSRMGVLAAVELVDDMGVAWIVHVRTREGAIWGFFIDNQGFSTRAGAMWILSHFFPEYALISLGRYDLRPRPDDHPYGLVPVEPVASEQNP